jgi:hypothetical protein
LQVLSAAPATTDELRDHSFVAPFLGFATFAQSAAERPRIPRVERAPKLADFVNGVARESELAISDFRQMDPSNGAAVSQPTTAYLSYDQRNLYVGWICKDDPAKVRARIAKRKDIESDDRVTINIDTFHDHKHAYWFDVNPYAIQFDGITTDGQGDDRSFETLWYTEAQFTADGYVVLETIPFRSLRFPENRSGAPQALHLPHNEFSMWPLFRCRTQFVDGCRHRVAEDISPGRNLQFIPYGLFSAATI